MLETWDCLTRIALAVFLGTAIGIEKQRRHKMIAIHTNALIASGSALFALLGVSVPNDSSPARVAAQIVSGIGFLGAGVIIHEGSNVSGIGTAATIFCSAAIGALCGCGFFNFAIIGTLFILLINLVLRPLGNRLIK